MTYITDARAEMRKVLDTMPLSAEQKQTLEDHHAGKLIESYRNGQRNPNKPRRRKHNAASAEPAA